MIARHHRMSAWGGIVFVTMFTAGWFLIAGFVPPPSPGADANEVAAFYQARPGWIMLGLVLVMVGTAPLVPFMAEITIQLARMEGRWPTFAISQVCLGVINVLEFLLAAIVWATAAFRPDRDPALILQLNDLGWMIILWPMSGAMLQNLLIGSCVFSDRNTPTVFPRWVGFFNIWFAMFVIPAALIVFFKAGPLAWNGLIAFWLPAGTYLTWIVVMSIVLLGAVKRHERSEPAAHPANAVSSPDGSGPASASVAVRS